MATQPILIAYDGSDLAQEAVREAATLFPGNRAIIITVWEPGLATLTMMSPGFGTTDPFPARFDAAVVEEVDHAEEGRASVVAEQGAELGRSLGLATEAHAVADKADIGATIAEAAAEYSVAAVVTGSHGITGLRKQLLGSTSRDILARCERPVLVVRGS